MLKDPPAARPIGRPASLCAGSCGIRGQTKPSIRLVSATPSRSDPQSAIADVDVDGGRRHLALNRADEDTITSYDSSSAARATYKHQPRLLQTPKLEIGLGDLCICGVYLQVPAATPWSPSPARYGDPTNRPFVPRFRLMSLFAFAPLGSLALNHLASDRPMNH